MHPQEAWWLLEFHKPKRFYGKLSEEEAEECYREIEADELAVGDEGPDAEDDEQE
jgi:hypothetical protein